MEEDPREARVRLGEAVQDDAPEFEGSDATLTGYVIVAEWMDSSGARWLSMQSSDAGGDPLPVWTSNGMLHEALNGEWPGRRGG